MTSWVLGTANFGQQYGISNKTELTENEIIEILQLAHDAGIKRTDTAQAYGQAEEILGRNLTDHAMKVTSKIAIGQDDNSNSLRIKLNQTLKNLQTDSIENLLVHSLEIKNDLHLREVNKALIDLQREGLFSNFGFSIYKFDEITYLMNAFPNATVFQVPENIIDQRLLRRTEMQTYSDAGINFQIRSIFLQGLLLQTPSQPMSNLPALTGYMDKFIEYCGINSISPLSACLSYAESIPWKKEIIFSVNSVKQMKEFIEAVRHIKALDLDNLIELSAAHIKEIDPRVWVTS